MKNTYKILMCCLIFIFSCQKNEKNTLQTEKVFTPTYSKGFFVEKGDGFIKMNVCTSKDTSVYYLTKELNNNINISKNQKVIQIPLQNVILLSTTQVSFLDVIQEYKSVIGMGGVDFISNQHFRKKIEEGKIKDVGGQELNQEVVLALQPKAIFTTGFEISDGGVLNKMQNAGIQIIQDAERFENHPLGRAEWMIFYAYFFGKEQEAITRFKEVEQKYVSVQQLIQKNAQNKPTVLAGLSYQGICYVPGGKSYMAQYFADAQAQYVWAENDNTAGLQVSFEEMYQLGLKADYWLNVGQANSLNELISNEARFIDFKAFKDKKVYNYTKRLNEKGWNDFFESSVVNPHLVLSDMAKVFHPELMKEQEFFYYKNLE
jgi:iron complex transport system substrate-binding protein